MGEILETRRSLTRSKLKELQRKLEPATQRARGKACVYLTGSFGRGEASRYSDLDLFIAGRAVDGRPQLSKLDEICMKADLIHATRGLGIPDFSGDGQYLTHYTAPELAEAIGTPEDDASNALTARLLLLLESEPLLEDEIYEEAVGEVIAAYWRDFEDHRDDFVPAFLVNDILRLWRTFCVNYEARTGSEPPRKKAKRKLKNYKLKHSRLLTCYSGLAYLLAVFAEKGTVDPDDAKAMTERSPTERLEWLAGQRRFSSMENIVQRILGRYEDFLAETDDEEETLVGRFLDPSTSARYSRAANDLGDLIYQLLEGIGRDTSLYRLLLV